jgi:hypothetical protein
VTALTALTGPPSRDVQLARARRTCRSWIDAIPLAEHGPLWDVLSGACDRAELLGLNDLAFATFVKNALRYRRYLQDHGIPETLAFTVETVEDYQLYVTRLRKTRSVPPAREGKPCTQKQKPVRRAAIGDEPRLAIGTQKDIVDGVRLLWRAARKNGRQHFTDFPLTSPTADLEWRDEEKRDPVRIELDLSAMLAVPFIPAKGRSRCEFERNLLLAHFYAAVPTRNTELREAVWEALQVWEIAPGAALPLRRWPLEALLCGEVALDETHVLFLTLGGAVPTKSDSFRSVPLVGDLADRAITYALAWVQGQLDALKYLRYRARRQLATGPLRAASFDQRALELLIDGQRLTVHELEQNFALFKGAHALTGPGVLKWTKSLHTLTPAEAAALRDLLWADATRYGDALAAFATKTAKSSPGSCSGRARAACSATSPCSSSGASRAGPRKAGRHSTCGHTRRNCSSRRRSRRCGRSVPSLGTQTRRRRGGATPVTRPTATWLSQSCSRSNSPPQRRAAVHRPPGRHDATRHRVRDVRACASAHPPDWRASVTEFRVWVDLVFANVVAANVFEPRSAVSSSP